MVKIKPNTPKQPAADSWLARAFPTFAGGGKSSGGAKGGKVTPRKGAPLKPSLPTVDLLPPRLELDRLKRSTRRGFIVSGFFIAVTAGLLYTGQIAVIELSSQELNAANAQVAQAQNRIAEFSAVQDYYQQVQTREELLAATIGEKVDYESLGNLVLSSLPPGATLTSFGVKAITPSSDPASNAASQCGPILDPFSTAEAEVVACITFDGVVSVREQIAQMTIDLSRSPLLVNINITEGGPVPESSGLTYKGTAAITIDAVRAAAGEPTNEENQ